MADKEIEEFEESGSAIPIEAAPDLEETDEDDSQSITEKIAETSEKVKEIKTKASMFSKIFQSIGNALGGILTNPVTWVTIGILVLVFILWTSFFSFGKNENAPCLDQVVVTTANILHDLNAADSIVDLEYAAEGSDIVMLQEFDQDTGKRPALEKFAQENGFDLIQGKSGNMLLVSKALGGTLVAQGDVETPTGSAEHGSRWFLWGTWDIGGTKLTVAGTHLMPFVETNGHPTDYFIESTFKQIQTIHDFSQEHIAAGENLIFAGDFNINYRDDRKVGFDKFLWSVLENKGNNGVLESVYTLNGINSKNDHSIGRGSSLIDNIFTGHNQFTAEGYQILYKTNSDHNFVQATYSANNCAVGVEEEDTGGLDMSSAAALARSIAWPTRKQSVVSCSTMVNCGANRAPAAYKKAKALAEKKGGKDGIRGLYASCDRFVATVLKNTVDPKVPWGPACGIHNYLSHSSKWKEVPFSQAKPGSPITSCSDHHVMIYLGGNQIADASFRNRVGAVQSLFSYYRHKGGYKVWSYVG